MNQPPMPPLPDQTPQPIQPGMPSSQSMPPIQYQPSRRSRAGLIIGIMIGVIVLLAGGAAAGYYGWQWYQAQQVSEPAPVVETPEEPAPTTATTTVSWQTPEVIAVPTIIRRVATSTGSYEGRDAGAAVAFKVGTISGGEYDGGEVLLLSVWPEGPALYPPFYRFIRRGDQLTLIAKQSGELYEGDAFIRSGFTIDNEFEFAELDFPPTLTTSNGAQLEHDEFATAFFNAASTTRLYTDQQYGAVHTTVGFGTSTFGHIFGSYGFYIRAADGTTAVYKLKIPFQAENNVPTITWGQNTINTTVYNPTDIGGCGPANYAAVVAPSVVKETDLRQTGRASNGDPIYELINSQHQILKDTYQAYGYFQTAPDQPKATYEQFIAMHPLIFWRDPFGRLIKFTHGKIMPMAECGKPVIYLYPETEQQVSVKVEPQGGMSYSDPAYNGGWVVRATPQGRLTEVSSGKQYPYLFWEGTGGIYQQPKQGFVVARQDVHRFLVSSLAKLGLNTQETADFIEFWEPRMQGAPYYFVSFLGTREMDRLAPLTIEPKPDTVIRVLMDFAPLQRPIAVEGYELRSIPRQGFTVIEWGGVLRGK